VYVPPPTTLPRHLTSHLFQADPTEKSPFIFGKIKGRAEKDLHELSTSLPSLRTLALRPAMIDPEGDPQRPRNAAEYLVQATGAVFRCVWPSGVIGTKPLARVLVDLATGDGNPLPPGPGIIAEGRTIRNTAARKLAGI